MKRLTLAAAIAVLATTSSFSAHAQYQPSIYGVLDASVGRLRVPGSKAAWHVDSGGLTTSFIGFKGSEDLGGGLKVRFQLEDYVRLDSGQSGRFDGDAFYSRDSFIGFQGAFGMTVLGRTATPFYQSTISFNPFSDSFGFSPTTRQYYGVGSGALLGDRSWVNSLSYTSNYVDSPFRLLLAANADEGSLGSTGRNLGTSLFYVNGPLALTVALQRVRNSALPLPVGFEKQEAFQFGATYDLNVVRLFGQYGGVSTHATVEIKSTLYQFGASVPLGAGQVLASYGHSDRKSLGVRTIDQTVSLAYDYNFSKTTDIYAAVLRERVTNLSSGSSMAAGLRIRF